MPATPHSAGDRAGSPALSRPLRQAARGRVLPEPERSGHGRGGGRSGLHAHGWPRAAGERPPSPPRPPPPRRRGRLSPPSLRVHRAATEQQRSDYERFL
ncbi:MAG: hypothetical protein FJ290_03345 [Planctomycetes bacterium]|nr:hypothetical protein [Planctomycetota bacterium]